MNRLLLYQPQACYRTMQCKDFDGGGGVRCWTENVCMFYTTLKEINPDIPTEARPWTPIFPARICCLTSPVFATTIALYKSAIRYGFGTGPIMVGEFASECKWATYTGKCYFVQACTPKDMDNQDAAGCLQGWRLRSCLPLYSLSPVDVFV